MKYKKIICFSLFSLFFSFLLVEFLFRIYLKNDEKLSPIDSQNITIYSHPFWEYDPAAGFNYPKNGRTDVTFFQSGRPVKCLSFVADEIGNPGKIPMLKNPKYKIFVFGDSFTFYSHGQKGDITWPTLLQTILQKKDISVEVRNYARDGTGILQMFDFGAHIIKTQRPDLMVFAFITSDLQRNRFWRVIKKHNKNFEAYTTIDPKGRLIKGDFTKTAYVNPQAARGWCEEIKKTQNLNDPTLKLITQQFFEFMRRDSMLFGVNVQLFSLNHSYVLNQLLYNDPFYSLKFSGAKSNLNIDHYMEDEGFKKNLKLLKESNIPILLIHLPEVNELKNGNFIYTDHQKKLYNSLLESTQFPIVNIISTSSNFSNPDTLYMLPIDAHPSFEGLQFFAEHIADELLENTNFKNLFKK